MSDILYGLVLGVATLLVVAVVHKVRALHARRAAAEPVIAANRTLARAPRAALGAAAVVEVALTIGVLLAPITVTLGIALLLGVYVVALRALPESSSCHCFGAVLDVGRSDAILRNVATGGICLGAAALWIVELLPEPELSGAALAAWLLVTAVVAALYLARHATSSALAGKSYSSAVKGGSRGQ